MLKIDFQVALYLLDTVSLGFFPPPLFPLSQSSAKPGADEPLRIRGCKSKGKPGKILIRANADLAISELELVHARDIWIWICFCLS